MLRLIFVEKISEDEALEKAKISSRIYEGWFKQEIWTEEYDKNMEICQRRADLIITAYKEIAAIKLVALTECEKEVTARQACLDILNMKDETKEKKEETGIREMKPETQKAILQIMKDDDEKK